MQHGLATTQVPESSPSSTNHQPLPFSSEASVASDEKDVVASSDKKLRSSSWLERRIIEYLYDAIGRPRIQLVLWDGTVIGSPAPAGQVVIHHPGLLPRLAWNPNLAFGEAYSDGTISVRGDLRSVLVEVNRGLSVTRATRRRRPTTRFTRTSHSLARSKSSVHHHYDLGNDFYRLWLDEQMVYTCAYYPTADSTLEEAQVAKLDYVCRKLRLKPGERVAEAGCGWGALALHMARHYGVSVQAYNLSTEQIEHARQWAAREGLSDRVQFVQDDYRHLTGQFDAFVSVGMLEHVGPENYRAMGQLISRILTPTGRGLIHSIGRNVTRPLDPWTDKYIFPGAHPPSLREMMDLFEESGMSVLDVENLRLHYARTCADWLTRFENVSDQVATMFDQRFVRMWRLYLAASSATFETGDLQLFQILFTRDSNNTIPTTRADWYAEPFDRATKTV